jgi:hypothetical protein
MNFLRIPFASLALSLALAACDDVPDRESDPDVELRGLGACPKCQLNSAQVNGVPFSYLDLTGEPNDQRVSVAYMRSADGRTADFGVYEEEIAAYDQGGLVAYGADLIGWELIFLVEETVVTIRISGRELLPSWAANGKPISVYALEVGGGNGAPMNICPGKKSGTASITLLHGETYDGEHKVIDKVGKQWATLACLNDALFKVKRLGYGPNGNQGPGGQPATPNQRTATLKMVTADYCGTGHSFTTDNTKIIWRNAAKTVITPDIGLYVQPEAVWTEKGASCIGKPRHVPLSQLVPYCKLPACKQYLASSPAPYEWMTFVTLF